MKKHVQLLLLLMGTFFLLISGCKKDDIQHARATTFTLTFTQSKSLSFSGYFVASGGVTSSGTCTMDVTPVGADSIHCTQTLTVPDQGSITILSHCSLPNNTGAWNVASGTGIYANLHGNGTLVMNRANEGPIELLDGKTWRQ